MSLLFRQREAGDKDEEMEREKVQLWEELQFRASTFT